MSSRSLGTLTLDLIARSGGFVQGMDRAERSSAKWRKQVDRDLKTIRGGIDKTLKAGAAAVAAATAATIALTKKGMDAVNSQAALAQSLDTTYDSITALQLAAGDTGLDGLEGSLTRLNRRLGAAEVGSGAAASAVKALQLDLEALSQMNVDERVATIADAIRDSGVSMQRAARFAQDLGFEQQQAAEFFMQGGDAIRAYRDEVDQLGLSLSAMEVAQVQEAINAMGIFGDLTTAVSQRLAAEFSPVLWRVAKDLEDAAKETGGFADEIEQLVDKSVRAAAFVASSIDAIGVVANTVAKAFVVGALQMQINMWSLADSIINGPTSALNGLIEVMNRVRGVDIEPLGLTGLGRKVKDELNILTGAIEIANQDIRDGLLEPLAGERLIKYFEDAKTAAESAAESAGELRNQAGGSAPGDAPKGSKTVDAIANEITALERAAKTWGMTADEVKLYTLAQQGATDAQQLQAANALRVVESLNAQAEAHKRVRDEQGRINSEAAGIAESLLTEEESILASYERRRQIILDNTKITGEAQTELLRRLEEERNEQLLEINGSYWERWLAGAEDALTNFDELAGSVVENFSSSFGNAFEAMIFDAQTLEEAVLNMAESMARSVVNALGEMAAQWLAYQVVQMMVGKTTQASAAMAVTGNAYAGVMQAGINAFASTAAIPIVGPAAAPAAMTAAVAATAPMAAAASAYSLMGMAHRGHENIPQEGTWLLDGGERVLSPEQNRDLTKFLSKDGQGSSTANTTNAPQINFNNEITIEAESGMSPDEARANGEAAAGAAKAIFVSMVEKESRPGGLLWSLYGAGR